MGRARKKRHLLRRLWLWAMLPLGLLLGANLWIVLSTQGRIYSNIADLPEAEVGLVLGTSPLFKDGSDNQFFHRRMEAAAQLYQTGKVKRLHLSGHRASVHYDEIREMRASLIALKIPAEHISGDGAGYRTLDSIVRANRVYGLSGFTVISQRDHNYRALFIAQYYGIEAQAFSADAADMPHSLKVGAREVLARIKAILDLYILGTQPIQPTGADQDQ